MRRFLVEYVGCVFITSSFCAALTSAADADLQRKDVWSKIAPFFQPPEEFVDDLGDYRYPLVFDDGRPVRTPDEWQQRRKEILRFWHEVLGPWPALIERPAVEVLQTEDRESLLQKKIRLQVAPELEIEGYLLIPPGDELRPAVLVVYYDAETGAGLNPKSKLRDFGYQLARRGFVSLSVCWGSRTGWP